MTLQEFLDEGIDRELKIKFKAVRSGVHINMESDIYISDEDADIIKNILVVSFLKQIGMGEKYIEECMGNSSTTMKSTTIKKMEDK